MAGRITVLRPGSLAEFTESLQKIKVSLLQHQVKLLIIDSMAALVSGEYEQGPQRQHPLGWHISFLKSLAEFSRIPVVMTNQVRSRSTNQIAQYSFQDDRRLPWTVLETLIIILLLLWEYTGLMLLPSVLFLNLDQARQDKMKKRRVLTKVIGNEDTSIWKRNLVPISGL